MKPKFFLQGLSVCLAIVFIAGTAGAFDQVVAFGDSLSDSGNLFDASGETIPDPQLYFEGRFSNGSVWVEYLALSLGIPLDNRAIGGATTGSANVNGDYGGLQDQIIGYLTSLAGGPVPSHTLITLWAGSNDFLGITDPAEFPAAVQQAIINIATALTMLIQAGATDIAVVNLPDLGKIPRTVQTIFNEDLTSLSQGFNQGLSMALGDLQNAAPHVNFYRIDAFALLAEVTADPESFGFGAADAICPNFLVPSLFYNTGFYRQPYVFWDDIHPTTEVHAFLAERAMAMVTTQTVAVDIKPGSCKNPLNLKSRGVLPVAVLGSADLDVYQIDPGSLTLNGVPAVRVAYWDVATPGNCRYARDGSPDLVAKFSIPDIKNALGDVQDGETVTLTLSGQLYDGTTLTGEDFVWVIKKFKFWWP